MLAVSPIILQYHDRDIYNDDNNDPENFITELFGKKNSSTEEIPLDKSKEISHSDMNPKLLTEKTVPKNLKETVDAVPDSSRQIRKKATLSFLNTDSTLDSENFTLPQDHQNNSFSTHFSGPNGSFIASGNKLEFITSSPVKIDSERINSDVIYPEIFLWLILF